MLSPLKNREVTVRGRDQRMCQASRQQSAAGTAVAMKAFESRDATVIVFPTGTLETMSSRREAMRLVTD